jgi:hypothetical protein
VNLERSQTILPFLSLMTPLSCSRAIRPRLAFAKSALSDHGSEAVEFLLNSRVDGDAGSLAVEAVCAATLRGAANNPTAAVAAVRQTRSRRFRFKLDIMNSVSRIQQCPGVGCKIEPTSGTWVASATDLRLSAYWACGCKTMQVRQMPNHSLRLAVVTTRISVPFGGKRKAAGSQSPVTRSRTTQLGHCEPHRHPHQRAINCKTSRTRQMSEQRLERRLAAILAADLVATAD